MQTISLDQIYTDYSGKVMGATVDITIEGAIVAIEGLDDP